VLSNQGVRPQGIPGEKGPWYIGASIAWTGSSVVIASRDGTNGDVHYWWQPAGSGTWHPELVIEGGEVAYRRNQNPAIAWTGTSVVITAPDGDGNLDYWWQPAGSATWHGAQVAAASGGAAYQNPAIAWTGSSVVITATDGDGNLYYWWGPSDGSNWHPELVVSAGELGEQGAARNPQNPAIAWTGTSVVITAPDWVGNLNYWWQQAGSATWHRELVAASGPSTGVYYENPAIAWTGTSVVITAPDSHGTLHYWWQPAGSATWHPEQVATGLQAGTAPLPYPAIAWTGTSVVITATDTNGDIFYWWQQAGSGNWHQEQLFQGLFPPADAPGPLPQNSSVAWTGTSVVVAATDGAGSLYYWWQQAGSSDWHREPVAMASTNP